MKLKKTWGILKQSFSGWSEDKATAQSAALAYYTIFSIAPLILIAVAVAGLFFGADASRGEIYHSISGLLGDSGAKGVESFVQASSLKDSGIIATIIGVVTLLLGATTMFAQLQDSLNTIWKVKPAKGEGIKSTIRQRVLSFSLILVISFLLLVSMILSAALAAVGKFAEHILPGGAVVWQIVNFAFSFAVVTVLFAAIYKILPDVKLKWKDVWVGGAITALFFTIGKTLIGLYLGHSGVSSTYGAAGSAIVILLWTYYSSAILLLGAEFTRFYSIGDQRDLQPKEHAEWIDPEHGPSYGVDAPGLKIKNPADRLSSSSKAGSA